MDEKKDADMKTIKKFLAANARALQLSFALAASTVVSVPVTDARKTYRLLCERKENQK